MDISLFAFVKDAGIRPQVIHYTGFPEGLMPNQKVHQVPLPWPHVVLIQGVTDGYLLIRYDVHGNFCGDTWHRDIDDAMEQAKYEYGSLVGEWISVPMNVDDPLKYALGYKTT